MTINRPVFPPLVPAASPASRRSVLFGLAAGVVASPAVALPLLEAAAAPLAETPLSPVATSVAGTDPIFAIIAEHRAHMRAWADGMEAEEMTEPNTPERKAATAAIDTASTAFEASIGEVLTVQPTTIGGLAALLEHVGQEEFLGMSSGGDRRYYATVLTTWLNTNGDDPRKRTAQDFPLRLASTVRAMAGTATIRRIEPSEPDPIYAAIKAERDAYAVYLATGEVQSRISDQDPDPIAVKPGVAPRKKRKTAAVKAWWAEYKNAEAVHEKSCQDSGTRGRRSCKRSRPLSSGCEPSLITSTDPLPMGQPARRSGMRVKWSWDSRPSSLRCAG